MFLKVAYEHKLCFFYGDDEKDLAKALQDMGDWLLVVGYQRIVALFFLDLLNHDISEQVVESIFILCRMTAATERTSIKTFK